MPGTYIYIYIKCICIYVYIYSCLSPSIPCTVYIRILAHLSEAQFARKQQNQVEISTDLSGSTFLFCTSLC